MAKYAIEGSQTIAGTPYDTALSIVADPTRPRRGKVYEFSWGPARDATPSDTIVGMFVGAITAEGTNTDVVPRPLDPADAATESDAGSNHTVEPTYTASGSLFNLGRHMRATFRWVATPGGELVYPATASNGLGFRPEHDTETHDEEVHAYFEEQ